jgi:phosphoglycolate phosphatase
MIGDRAHDVRAAARHGLPTIGVLWAHGSAEELRDAGAAALAAHARELVDLVVRCVP